MARALILYAALIAIFYVQTEGFMLHHGWLYCMLKTFPCLALSAIVYFEHTPLQGIEAFVHAFGLFFGSMGDLFIALYDGGVVSGAIAFGIGHLLYMSKVVTRMNQLSKGLTCIVFMYGAFMIYFFLIPEFSEAPFSTSVFIVYTVILCTSVVLCGSVYFHGTTSNKMAKQNADLIRFIGYGLFFISDSLILLNYAGSPLPYHHFATFSTYFTSQYMILVGATQQLV